MQPDRAKAAAARAAMTVRRMVKSFDSGPVSHPKGQITTNFADRANRNFRRMPAFDALFVTALYRASLGTRLNGELKAASLLIAAEDKAGRRWAREHGYKGYTSYAALDDLPLRAPAFADLVKR